MWMRGFVVCRRNEKGLPFHYTRHVPGTPMEALIKFVWDINFRKMEKKYFTNGEEKSWVTRLRTPDGLTNIIMSKETAVLYYIGGSFLKQSCSLRKSMRKKRKRSTHWHTSSPTGKWKQLGNPSPAAGLALVTPALLRRIKKL
ncbi:hypothetical protein EK904_004703 [Melospiza melodia maxima]|nr:hypothetical protein EK904_004703 [Melospiza melodia maxima]